MIIRVQPFGTDFVGLFLLLAKGKLHFSSYVGNKSFVRRIKDVPSEKVDMETHLLGLFYGGNSKGIVGSMPGIGASVFETRYTAIGNLVAANDKGAIISPLIKGLQKKIGAELGVPVRVGTVAGLNIPGSLIVANNRGACVHPEASEEEMETIGRAMGVPVDVATIGKSGYLGAMAVASDDALITTPSILAPEMAHVMEVLEID